MKLFKRNILLFIFFIIALVFYYPFIIFGKLPVPADTIVGMYHPYRDVVFDNYVSGVPFKNFLITDPVRQQYLWRKLAIEELKKGNLPVWNPYSFSGTPLLANFQSAVFYPLNLFFFLLPFEYAWSFLILISSLLSGLFLYFYLKNLKLNPLACFFGALTFSFSGFSIAWLEWNTILHTVLWFPLILLSIDKIIKGSDKSRSLIWPVIFIFSLLASFFAGHLQIFFYGILLTFLYLLFRLTSLKKGKAAAFLLFIFYFILFLILSSPQWYPALKFINLSNRQFDLGNIAKEGFFLPVQNLVQFFAPDFFGNPSTGNYFGIWNYAEFVGFIGILGLMLAVFSLIFVREKTSLFYFFLLILSLSLALPTPLGRLPYLLNLPFLSTGQPSRFIYLSVFSLVVLSAFGLDKLVSLFQDINQKRVLFKRIFTVFALVASVFLLLWLALLFPYMLNRQSISQNTLISSRNLVLPCLFLLLLFLLFIISVKASKKSLKYIIILVLLLHSADLLRFSWKFTPFTDQKWLYPETKILNKINNDKDIFRIMTLDRRILPPNFSLAYKFQDVAGYDPLYLKNYAQLVSSWDKNGTDLTPAAFNRIITPQKADSFLTDLLNVKYVLSFDKLDYPKLTLIDQEGETYLYRNNNVFPRAFLVDKVIRVLDDQMELDMMFSLKDELKTTALTQKNIIIGQKSLSADESVTVKDYRPNRLVIKAKTDIDRLLVISDIYFPFWKARVNGRQTVIYPVDYLLRGIVVPAGVSEIIMTARNL